MFTKRERDKGDKVFAKVVEKVLEEPKRLNMNRFLYKPDEVRPDRLPPCGTVACLAGWAVAVKYKLKNYDQLRRRELGSGLELEGADALAIHTYPSLFYPSQWPADMQDKLIPTKPGTAKYARIVVGYATKWMKDLRAKQAEEEEQAKRQAKRSKGAK